jgi:hypothetical protein
MPRGQFDISKSDSGGRLKAHISDSVMAPSSIEPLLKGDAARKTRGLLRLIILCTIAAAAVSSRLFSVISTYEIFQQGQRYGAFGGCPGGAETWGV